MYPVSMKVNGHYYPSSESAFQSFKYADPEKRLGFTGMSGFQAKTYWKTHKDEIRSDWNDIKLEVMEKLIRIKFYSNHNLSQKLISTGRKSLIEGNEWNDTYWGVCKNRGENNLGKILMKIRGELTCQN
jgi:hypothetical protein